MSDHRMTTVCPICHTEQFIQRVSAVVSAGTTTGYYSGPSSGTVSSGDQKGNYSGYSHLSGTTKSNLAQMLECPGKPRGAYYIWTKRKFWTYFLLLWFPTCAVGSLILAGMLLLGIAKIGDEVEERAKQKSELARWKAAVIRWERLYYCHKDGVVFDPMTMEYCEPPNTFMLAYQQPVSSSLTA